MNYKYFCQINGGYGPDVWEEEKEIMACDFVDAAKQAVAQAQFIGGVVVSLEQAE